MKTVALVSQKGGAGKSTLAINLAVAASLRKLNVLLLDLDPQQTAENWYQYRECEWPALATLSANELEEALDRAKKAGMDWVFIDTPGRDEPAVATAIKHADYCLLPCRPSPADLLATPPTVSTLRRLGTPFAFILNQTPPRGSRLYEALAGLSDMGDAIPKPIVMRVTYQDALASGQGVQEYEPNGKAATEVRELWKWLNRRMKGA